MGAVFTMAIFRDVKEVLASRNFAPLWACVLISQVGDWLQITAQSWLVLEITNSAFAVSAAAASGTISQLLFVILGGVAADRYQKKRILKSLAIAQLLISTIYSILVVLRLVNVLTILLFTFLLGTCAALWQPVYLAYIPQLVPQKRLGNAMGLSLTGLYTARTFGPILAGLSISILGVRNTYILNSISFLFPLIVLLLIKLPEIYPDKQVATPVQMRVSNLQLVRDPILFPLWFLNLGISLLILPVFALLPVFARDVLRVDATGLGILMGACGIGQLLGAIMTTLLGGVKNPHYGLYQILGYVVIGLQVVFFSLSTSLSTSMMFLMVFNFLHGLLSPRVNTIVQLYVPTSLRGTIQSLFLFVFGLVPIGQILLGGLASLISPQIATLFFSGSFTILAVFTLATARKLRSIAFKKGTMLLG
jgi:MFS family permease